MCPRKGVSQGRKQTSLLHIVNEFMEAEPEMSTCGQLIGFEALKLLKIASLLYIITAVSRGY